MRLKSVNVAHTHYSALRTVLIIAGERLLLHLLQDPGKRDAHHCDKITYELKLH